MLRSQGKRFNSWYKIRGYIHFDRKVSKKFAFSYVTDPKKIEVHAFLPFLKYVKVTPRYKFKEHKTVDKKRPILYAGHLDSHIYAWYAQQLSEQYEKFIQKQIFNQSVLAYRSLGKSNIEFAKEVFDTIEQRRNCNALAFDLTGFFDHIDHAKLKSAWCKVLEVSELPTDHYKVYKSITKYAYVKRDEVFNTLKITDYEAIKEKGRFCTSEEFRKHIRASGCIEKNSNDYGIPQGSPISAVLSNIYLIEFDRVMSEYALEIDGVYRRYCDDILWICPPEKAKTIEELVHQEINRCGEALSPNSDKTERFLFQDTTEGLIVFRETNEGLIKGSPLQYLGFTFDGQQRFLRSQTVSRYYRRMKGAVRKAGHAACQAKDSKIHRKDIYEKYTHLGQHSFFSYAARSSEIMDCKKIHQQVSNHWEKLHKEIKQVEMELKKILESQSE
ncbi:antiviral reverse transcriptase Drt2 [Calothrix sp. NIES-2098]|uniref:antiviral reverse transcriptase Drt2 n=1 Tax=Calothrix sp. NIES-2098 TaxID=1954171 RepID=UPI000B5E00D3|nr:hypothetical protein NIES2098_40390 [Calothrix sp. NIES-2098]